MSLKGREKLSWKQDEIKKCKRKVRHVTLDEAIARTKLTRGRVYRCRWCDMWHLTSCLDGYSVEYSRCKECDSAQCAKIVGHSKICTGNQTVNVSADDIRDKFTEFLFGK